MQSNASPASCPHFSLCGGCSQQALDESAYYAFKKSLLERAVESSGYNITSVEDVVRIGAASRRRVEFRVKIAKGEVSLGYYQAKSHEVVDIAVCPVTEPALTAHIMPLKAWLSTLKKPGNILSIQMALQEGKIEMLLRTRDKLHPKDSSACEVYAAEHADIARIAVQAEADDAPEILINHAPLTMTMGEVQVELPVAAFTQATEKGQQVLTDAVLKYAQGRQVADLYAGCGTYSFPLAQAGFQVSAYEGGQDMVLAASSAAKRAGIEGRINFSCRDLVKFPVHGKLLENVDTAVINPPRAGAAPQTRAVAKAGVARIIMVSCNPTTLAGDLKYLNRHGYRLITAIPVDQFYWTKHLESVVVLEKNTD